MGGCTFYLTGKSKSEVRRAVSKKLAEAKHANLYEDRRSPILYDPGKDEYYSLLRVHT